MPSVKQIALRVPTIENKLVAPAEHVQQAIRENRPGAFWGTTPRNSMDIIPPSISSPSSGQVRFRQRLDNPSQNSMSKLNIGPPPALPPERDVELQLENVPTVGSSQTRG